jgi:hypothetical protein
MYQVLFKVLGNLNEPMNDNKMKQKMSGFAVYIPTEICGAKRK